MERLISIIESMLNLISFSEMKNNSKAMAKAQRIKVQIEELKEEKRNQEVIQYIDKEMLLRN
jgi:hypothetical protein